MTAETSEFQQVQKERAAELYARLLSLRAAGSVNELATIATTLSMEFCTYLDEEQGATLAGIFTELLEKRKRDEQIRSIIARTKPQLRRKLH